MSCDASQLEVLICQFVYMSSWMRVVPSLNELMHATHHLRDTGDPPGGQGDENPKVACNDSGRVACPKR